jgi:spore coat polysaccharide biosynthesis protein SpsF
VENLRIVAVTQARVGSTRFPKKVMKEIADTTLLGLHLERISKSKLVDEVIVATTNEDGVESIIGIANAQNIKVYQGSTEDVLDRFYLAVKDINPDYVVRITSDCPLLDPELIDLVIHETISKGADYGANIFEEEFPDGQDIEVFRFSALKKAWNEATLKSDREHVTPFIRNNTDIKGGELFKGHSVKAFNNYNHIRMTVDEPQDLDCIKMLVDKLGKNESWKSYTDFIVHNIELFKNQDIIRNEGYLKSLKKDNI